jgi:hypothetical protein
MTRAQQIILVISSLAVLYCCVWLPITDMLHLFLRLGGIIVLTGLAFILVGRP